MAWRRANRAKNPDRLSRGGTPPPGELSEDTDVVRAMYRALEAGDYGALVRTVDEEIVWVDPLVSRLPFDGTRRGLPAVLQAAFGGGERGGGMRVSAATFLEMGDGVLVAGRLLKGTEEKAFLHECSARNGKVFLIRGYPAGISARR